MPGQSIQALRFDSRLSSAKCREPLLLFASVSHRLSSVLAGVYAQYAFRSLRRRCHVPALEENGNCEVPGTPSFSSRNAQPVDQNDPTTPLADEEGPLLDEDPLADVELPDSLHGLLRQRHWERASRSCSQIGNRVSPVPSEVGRDHHDGIIPHKRHWPSPSDTPPKASTPIAPLSPGCRASVGATDTVKRDLLSFLDLPSPDSRQSSPPRSFTSMTSSRSRKLCSGLTKLGAPCKSSCVKGKDFCHNHQ